MSSVIILHQRYLRSSALISPPCGGIFTTEPLGPFKTDSTVVSLLVRCVKHSNRAQMRIKTSTARPPWRCGLGVLTNAAYLGYEHNPTQVSESVLTACSAVRCGHIIIIITALLLLWCIIMCSNLLQSRLKGQSRWEVRRCKFYWSILNNVTYPGRKQSFL